VSAAAGILLTALSHTVIDLGVAFLVVAAIGALFVFAVLIGRGIHALEAPAFEAPREPEPEDLDDWLADTEPFFEFNLCEHPKAKTRLDRGAA